VRGRGRTPGAGERGSAVVELALLLPVLFLVLLAAVQVGLLARDRLLVQEAARAGARAASVSLQDADARAAALRAAPGLDPERLEVAVAREGGQGTVVTVEVAYRARIAGPIAGWLLPAEVTLEGAAAMRQEVG
jgi:Flp pilus assembly protein TadG